MNNLVKRIVQKELENHEELSEKKKKQADSRLEKLLEKICGKKNQYRSKEGKTSSYQM